MAPVARNSAAQSSIKLWVLTVGGARNKELKDSSLLDGKTLPTKKGNCRPRKIQKRCSKKNPRQIMKRNIKDWLAQSSSR